MRTSEARESCTDDSSHRQHISGTTAANTSKTDENASPCCRCHCNSVWSVWYTLITLATTCLLLIQASSRFIDYTRMAWPERDRPFWELNAYIALAGAAVVLTPLFVVAGLFRLGNLANDGVTLGRHAVSTCSQDTSLSVCTDSWLRRIWTHAGPVAPLLHIVMSLLLLAPRLIMQAKLIHLGYLRDNRLFESHLDMLYRSPEILQDKLNMRNVSRSLHSQLITPEDILYTRIKDHYTTQTFPCVEMLNFTAALVIFSVQYSACLWGSNKFFGMLFSIYNLVTSAVCLFAWDGLSILYKVQILRRELSVDLSDTLIMSLGLTVALGIMYMTLMLSTTSIIYMYGHQKYQSYLNQQKSRYQISLRPTTPSSFFEYTSHCSALLFLLLSIVVSGPIIHDLAVVYRTSGSLCCMVALAAMVLHLFVWVLLWLLLSVKHSWTFKLSVTVGNAYLRSAENIKLVYRVDLKQKRGDIDAPMMLVENGTVTTLDDLEMRKRINDMVDSHRQGKRLKWEEEEIYWHRPDVHTADNNDPDSGAAMTGVMKLSEAENNQINDHNSLSASKTSAVKSGRQVADPFTQRAYRYFPEDMNSAISSAVTQKNNTTSAAVVNCEQPTMAEENRVLTTITESEVCGSQHLQLFAARGDAERSCSDDTTSSSGVHSGSSQLTDLEVLPPPPQLMCSSTQLCTSMSLQRPAGRHHLVSGDQQVGVQSSLQSSHFTDAAALTLPPRLTASATPALSRHLQLPLPKLSVPKELLQRLHQPTSLDGLYDTHPAPQPSDHGVRIDLGASSQHAHQQHHPQEQQTTHHIYGNTMGLVDLRG